MRSLNRSLPSSNQPSEEVLRVFKAAAVSVTNLYKAAINEQAQARAAGYQDALDELLSFLDLKNLGLDDGEGWEVRQWATERLEIRPNARTHPEQQNLSESEDEKEPEKEKSPEVHQRESSPMCQATSNETNHEVSVEGATQSFIEAPKQIAMPPSSDTFNFQSIHPYPRDAIMQTVENQNQRREISPRTTRQNQRKGSKHWHKGFSIKGLGSGGGSKRKLPFGEFFDISSIVDNNDGARKASKRGKTG